jgi:RNA polymerase sigma-70 factor (ECF subfamily)
MQPVGNKPCERGDEFSLTTGSSLIHALRDFSPKRWEKFVLVYSPLLRYWINRSRVQHSCQDDILQECFMSIATSIAHFEKGSRPGTFRSWLKTIVQRRVADYFRSHSKECPGDSAGVDELSVTDQKDPTEIEQEEQAMTDLKARAMDLVKHSTAEKTWQMFWLSVVENIPTAEVARQFQVSNAAVRVARGRVLNRLRDLMLDDMA